MNVRGRSRKLLLAALLTTSGVSTSGIAVIAAPGMSATVTVSSIPHLAQALGIVSQGVRPHKARVIPNQPIVPTKAGQVVGVPVSSAPITPVTPTNIAPQSTTPPVNVGVSVTSQQPVAQQLSLGMTNLLAGESATRFVNVTNTGNVPVVSLTIGVTPNPMIPLISSSSEGISVTVSQCSVAWSGNSCGGVSSIGSPAPLASLSNMVITPIAGGTSMTDHLAFTFSLPQSSTLSGEHTTLTWILTATGQ